MDGKTLREQIVFMEWEMFQATHNQGGRASCQDDYVTFYNMRIAQFDAWSDKAAESYLEDLKTARKQNRNLVAEKYLNMMKYTHPAEYEAQKTFLPFTSAEKILLVNEICDEMIEQTILLRKAFPRVSGYGRPLFSKEDGGGFTSLQTYLRGELLTYSERTLQLLKEYLFTLKAEGRSLAEDITFRSVCAGGFSSLEEAEAFLEAKQKK